MEYKTRKDYVENLILENKLNEVYNKNSNDKVALSRIPNSMDEARAYSNFWSKVIDKFKGDITQIGFFYKEKNKELPLSSGKKFLKSIGLKVNPKFQEGIVRYEEITPEPIRFVNPSKSLVNLITNKDDWERLNLISGTTEDFSAPYVFLPEHLCYQVNIPLECIDKVNFNSPDFLNKSYENSEVKQ